MNKRRLGIGVAAMVMVGAAVFVYWSHGPSVSKINNTDRAVKGVKSPDYSTKLFQNDYISSQIPQRYQVKTTTNGTGKPLYIQQLLTASSASGAGLYADQLAIAVGVLPNGGITDVADVQLRSRTVDYKSISSDWLGSGALLFERGSNGYEIGLFVANRRRYATVVLSGTADKKDQLLHELQTLYTTLVWK